MYEICVQKASNNYMLFDDFKGCVSETYQTHNVLMVLSDTHQTLNVCLMMLSDAYQTPNVA